MTDILIRLLMPMGLAGTIGWGLLQLSAPLLSKLPARWHKIMLVACLLLFLAPLPLLSRDISAALHSLRSTAPMATVYSAGAALSHAADIPASLPPAGAAASTVGALIPQQPIGLLAAVYWLGATLSLAWAVLRHSILLHRIRTTTVPVTNPQTLQLYREICDQLDIAHPPALCHNNWLKSPVLSGIWRSQILLPAQGLTTEQMRFALLHELWHYKSRDLLFKYTLLAAGIIHWYNPAVYLLRRQFSDVCEQSCDEAVAQHLTGVELKQYASVLLDFSGPVPSPLVSAFASPAARLRTRLTRLLRPVQPGKTLRLVGILLPAVLLMAAVLAGCGLAAGAAVSPAAVSQASSALAASKAPAASASLPSSQEAVMTSSGLPVSSPAADAKSTPQSTAPEETQGTTDGPTLPLTLQNPVPDYDSVGRTFIIGDHRGLDFRALKGTNIVASAPGTVVTSKFHYSYGNYVVIDHGNGLTTLYAHNKENLVAVGQRVDSGDVIATVGDTGNSNSTHCHVEVHLDNNLLDPAKYIVM